ncbi:YozE family protein [Gracilibacillus sp. YIM 98692]|uniref:YozE family protein n=1 Tax=Gracilibacillus sp. YIM 98692 TaxID=2663532 RepID=UPI0013D590FD|nr:YozE family protein [Gracilibacillus sp. YIM 98692]
MQTFYHFMMRFRGNKEHDDSRQLAEWMFKDHSFPKHATNYDEISDYLEWNVPFPQAISTFDEMWDQYIEEVKP